MNIIKVSMTEVASDARVDGNWGPLVDCYGWVRGRGSIMGLNYEAMGRAPKKTYEKTGSKRGRKKGGKSFKLKWNGPNH